MSTILTSLFLTMLAFTAFAQAPSTVSFDLCVNSIQRSAAYIEALTILTEEKSSTDSALYAKNEQIRQQIADFKSSFSIADCMQGNNNEIYSCLIQHAGNFTRCH